MTHLLELYYNTALRKPAALKQEKVQLKNYNSKITQMSHSKVIKWDTAQVVPQKYPSAQESIQRYKVSVQ